jgi:hypothetical protein
MRGETRDAHGRTFVEETGAGLGRDFYVTVIDGPRTGYLLGPFDTHREALDRVDLGRILAEKHNTRALFGGYAYGTASAPHGTQIKTVFGRGEQR